MSAVNNIPTGLLVAAQLPLDVKLYIDSEASLVYLGINNNLAYTYYEGMIVYCVAEKRRWEWREGTVGETGLLPTGFTYPNGLIVNNVDYSNKTFNFYFVIQNVKITTIGTGMSIYSGVNILTNTHEFFSFRSSGLNIFAPVNGEIFIESKQGENLGTGVYAYKGLEPTSKLHQFRSLKPSTKITINQTATELQFDTPLYQTVIQQGTNISITGTGTSVDPWIISAIPADPAWITGDIKEVYCTNAYIAANFVSAGPTKGLGTGPRLGWAICNGNNGTPNDDGRTPIAWGYYLSNYECYIRSSYSYFDQT